MWEKLYFISKRVVLWTENYAFVVRKPGRLPVPLSVMVSCAEQHDLPVAKQIMEDCLFLKQGRLYADKAYADAAWAELLKKDHAMELLTPRKRRKGDALVSGDSFSSFVCFLRQPVEYFFNCLNRLTNIQSDSFVRSLSGLFLHVFRHLAAASVSLLFNP